MDFFYITKKDTELCSPCLDYLVEEYAALLSENYYEAFELVYGCFQVLCEAIEAEILRRASSEKLFMDADLVV